MHHIYLCECILKIFIAWTYSSHPWLWPAYAKSRFAFIRTVEVKGLCLQLKRPETKYAAQKINFLTSAVANDLPLPLWKVSLGSDELLMSLTYLFFHPINMSSKWRHKFYWLWLIFGQFLLWNYSSLNRYNSGTRRDIKKQSRGNSKRRSFWFLLLFQIRYWKNISFTL